LDQQPPVRARASSRPAQRLLVNAPLGSKTMKKRIAIIYLIGIHLLLALVLLKSDFLDRMQAKLGIQESGLSTEITQHFHRMLRYHKRMDGNVPDGSVVFIGDSITQGLCVSAVACPSVNYGIGSDTTLGVLQRLPDYRSIDRASAVVLAIGINDMKRRSNEEIIENYQSIVGKIPKTTPIVFSAVLPLDEESREEWQGRNQDRTKRLNSSIQRLADTDSRVFFVDAGPLLVDASGNLADKFHDGDGVHLNSQGNAIWINALQDGIQRAQQSAALDRK
jgi:lysophospholipase L1-like esterase